MNKKEALETLDREIRALSGKLDYYTGFKSGLELDKQIVKALEEKEPAVDEVNPSDRIL